VYFRGYIFWLRTAGAGKQRQVSNFLIAGHAVRLLWERHTAHDEQENAQGA
jgi:hypothetical protein